MLGKLVYIEWVDSCSPSGSGWIRLEEVNAGVLKCKSVGWVDVEDDEGYTISCHTTDGGQIGGTMTIPKVSVTKLLILEIPGARTNND